MLGYSILNNFPKNLRARELFVQVASIVDHLLSKDYVGASKLADMYHDITSKYTNYNNISVESLYALIDEAGYRYIVDAFKMNDTQLRTFFGFLTLVHIMKGSRKGLETVLNLVGVESYQITEWWEDPTNLDNLTFKLEMEIQPFLLDSESRARVAVFTRNYVFPILASIIITSTKEISLKLAVAIKSSATFNLNAGLTCMIWGVSNWDRQNWCEYRCTEWDNDNWDEDDWCGEPCMEWDADVWDEQDWCLSKCLTWKQDLWGVGHWCSND